ncbi:MAG: nuclear transport factor 2 family protein [Proteobacteria bacterium]|nr:nuclear transport factor 2 family protein [Pseudomonadota bacterium]
MTPIERLVALEEIRQLAQRYAVYLDARDLDRLVELYPPDVRVGRERRGREALREDFDRQLRAVGITFLHVGNHVIDFEADDRAHGIVYCRGEIQDGGHDSERWIIHAIQYHDTYERRDGRWYFSRRRHLLVYGADLGVNPLSLPPAEWPRSQTGLGSVPHDLETWRRFWGIEPA